MVSARLASLPVAQALKVAVATAAVHGRRRRLASATGLMLTNPACVGP